MNIRSTKRRDKHDSNNRARRRRASPRRKAKVNHRIELAAALMRTDVPAPHDTWRRAWLSAVGKLANTCRRAALDEIGFIAGFVADRELSLTAARAYLQKGAGGGNVTTQAGGGS